MPMGGIYWGSAVFVVVVVVVGGVGGVGVVVAVVAAGLSAVLWGTVWVGSVLLYIRCVEVQIRTSPVRKFLSIWSHMCLRCLCEKRGVASARRSSDSKQKCNFLTDFPSTPGGVKTHPFLR